MHWVLYSLRKPDNTAIPFRVHKRLVMSPIGEPLETVESVHELIVVLGDAMRCHTEVLQRCNILHRDISDNNILVVREEGRPVRGLLVDFDNSLDMEKDNGETLCIGTKRPLSDPDQPGIDLQIYPPKRVCTSRVSDTSKTLNPSTKRKFTDDDSSLDDDDHDSLVLRTRIIARKTDSHLRAKKRQATRNKTVGRRVERVFQFHSILSTDDDGDDETDTEADMWVKTRLIRDADAVLDIAKPRSAAGRVLVSNISKHISAELEHRLNTASTYAIADTSKTQLASEAPMQNNNYRQLLLSDTTYTMGKDEHSAAIANAFAGGSSIEPLNSFCYDDAFAVIEARPGKTRRTIDKAYAQLMQSTRSIYKAQFDRRFAFGLTVCDNEVRVCLFSNDVVFSSSALDISTAFGRQQFIELLVYWSLCDEDQLGFDTTVYWDKDNNYGTIECPDIADESSCSAATKMYYFDKVLPGADSLFGRHTRCFLVTDERPSGDKIKPKFALKDTWPEATEDPARDRRDEVMFMRRITEELVNSDVEDLVYPRLEAGGRVSFDTDGGRFEDNTRNALGPLYSLRKPDNTAIPFRVHKRLVMSPIGEPLETVESVHELIVVLGDAMRCHSEVLRRCNILHRDISNNNILVVREEGRPVRGLLVDFDCAVDVSEHQAPNPENVGTFPYRSISNLFGSNVERTELDDWESLFYLLCHCATHLAHMEAMEFYD
ncbi:hypothetical protein DL89DRAFT_296772 [Linderina pennispora]|uniref:Protein kinase domain-containing protein n=1 Tax=Linderina pennispora TaxID=61395 RepID=A0A1Y1VUG0_9FUNG|nr:uncharacterized protein DL89DRAFT_296772 [Linderina pennispora]ORX64931.1 hypothetical protein DL89DRAFT_296772 [Linderina pennispora]